VPGRGSDDQGSAQARTFRRVQSSETDASPGPAEAVCLPAVQDWRRRRPSKTSTAHVVGPWRLAEAGRATSTLTLAVCPAAAANDQYR